MRLRNTKMDNGWIIGREDSKCTTIGWPSLHWRLEAWKKDKPCIFGTDGYPIGWPYAFGDGKTKDSAMRALKKNIKKVEIEENLLPDKKIK